MKHGKGKFTYANGNIYEGVWIYGNKYENEDKNKDEWKDDERNGKDILYLNDVNIYEGNPKDDAKEEEEKIINELNINENK